MENVEHILKALRELDPENENHWTAEGLPKLETLTFMSAGAKFKRDEVSLAAPEFTRYNLVLPEVVVPAVVQSADPVLHEAIVLEKAVEAQSVQEKVVMVAKVEVAISDALNSLFDHEKIDYKGMELAELRQHIEAESLRVEEILLGKVAINNIYADHVAHLDDMILHAESIRPKTTSTVQQLYLASQATLKPTTTAPLETVFVHPVDRQVPRRR